VPAGRAWRGPGCDGEALGGQPRPPGSAGLGPPGEPLAFGVQMPGRPAGGGGLRRPLLRRAQLDDGLHELGEADDQQRLGGGRVVAGERGTRQPPGNVAQAVPAGVGLGMRA